MIEDNSKDNEALVIELYNKLIALITSYHPSSDITLIEKAFNVANKAHKGQLRKSGEPFFIHPINTAIILAELKLDKETIVAALLHDVVEDTYLTHKYIASVFSEEVAFLVEGVTKLQQLSNEMSKNELKLNSFRKLVVAMAEDIRVIIIKLADRLHNMITLEFQSPKKQIEISNETIEIYSPIAQRLGISSLTTKLEDLAFKYLYPEEYNSMLLKLKETEEVRSSFMNTITEEMSLVLKEGSIHANVTAKLKHLFSIYRKMIKRGETLEEIYDIFTIKIVVDSVKDCYLVLGLIHEMYKPIPERFKDYISLPKENMYQSLHTTLVSKKSSIFEVQIKTKDMDDVSTYGILAHWKYGEQEHGVKAISKSQAEKAIWLKKILEWQLEISDNNEFMDLVKSDFNLFSETINCFTIGGEIKTLPKGSSVIDFAYLIHSKIGNKAVSAIVNGKEESLHYILNNGDQVEILTSESSSGPNSTWLDHIATANAKNKIKKCMNEDKKSEYAKDGLDKIMQLIQQNNYNSKHLLDNKYTSAISKKYGFSEWENLLYLIGIKKIKASEILDLLIAEVNKQKLNLKNIIKMDSCYFDKQIKYAKCCHPIPGDQICGINTVKRGILIHKMKCEHIKNCVKENNDRLITMSWMNEAANYKYSVKLKLHINIENSYAIKLFNFFVERDIEITECNYDNGSSLFSKIQMTILINNNETLKTIMKDLELQNYIYKIERD